MVIANTRPTNLSLSSSDIFQIFLEDEDGQSILGIDDGALRQSLHIRIVNTSGKNINLIKIDTINSTHYNFAVCFRLGTLLDISSIKFDEANGWEMYPNNNTFYFGISENKTIPNGESITLTLENIGAAPAGGSRGTRVEVKYDNLKYQGSDDRLSGSRLLYLNIVNHRGKKQVPLYAGFLGSNTILNDGSENELVLTIQNLPRQSFSFNIMDSSTMKMSPSTSTQDSRWQNNLILFIQEKIPNFETIYQDIQSNENMSSGCKAFFKEISQLLKQSSTEKEANSFNHLKEEVAKLKLGDQDKRECLKILIDNLDMISEDDLNIIVQKVQELFSLNDLSMINNLTKNSQSLHIIQSKLNQSGELKLRGVEAGEITLDQVTKFTISFDVTTTEDTLYKNWALLDKTDADKVQISILSGQENWVFGGVEKQGITPQWNFLCQKGWSSKNNERSEILRLRISNLKTLLLSGYANLYVHYENIPGYWDGFITVPIHKGPLVYRQYEEPSQDHHHIDFVGIGVIKPQAMLHIKPPESHKDDLALKVEGNTAIAGNLAVTGGKVGIGITPSPQQSEQLRVQGNTAIAGNLEITQNKVGIGTGSPEEKLHIQNGSLRIDDGTIKLSYPSKISLSDSKDTFSIFMDTAGALVFESKSNSDSGRDVMYIKSGSYGWQRGSDLSLKSNISSLKGILSKIIKLNPVRFEWKSTQAQDIGFIAQDVEQIFPELVSSVNTENGELKGLDYTKFGILAIAAIKEVAENLQELKQKYDDLAIVNQDLQRRLEKLENRD